MPLPATSPIPIPTHLAGYAQPQYITFDPSAPDLTHSKFFAHLGGQQQQQHGESTYENMHRSKSADSRAVAAGYHQHHQPQQTLLYASAAQSQYDPPGSLSRSTSAEPYMMSGSVWQQPQPGRTLSPGIVDILSPEEQARVLANSAPTSYDAAQRAHLLQLQQQQQYAMPNSGSPGRSPSRRDRRQSMPVMPQNASPISFFAGGGASRTGRTPPLAPSSRFTPPLHAGAGAAASTAPALALPMLLSADGEAGGLETIGEDGESQAGGTLRLRTLPRSMSFDSASARGGSQISIKSVKAVHVLGASVDEEGNTSVSLLEDIVDRQERERQQAAEAKAASSERSTNSEANFESNTIRDLEKSLPRPPVPSGKDVGAKASSSSSSISANVGKPTLRNMFDLPSTGIVTAQNLGSERPKATSLVKPHVSPSRRSSQSLMSMLSIPPKPTLKSSISDSGLSALETRLSSSRSSSPISISPTSPLPDALMAAAAAGFKSMTLSPPLRAVSPALHVGNAGALRKKSSVISLRRKESAASLASMRKEKPLPSVLDAQKSVTKGKSRDLPAHEPEAARNGESKAFEEAAASRAKEAAAQIRRNLDARDAMRATNSIDKQSAARAAGGPARMKPGSGEPETLIVAMPPKLLSSATKAVVPSLGNNAGTRGASPARYTLEADSNSVISAGIASGIASAPGKRLVSDPTNGFSKPVPAKEIALRVPRRHSVEPAQSPPDEEKYGSLRGGRGGQVTDVAKQWATLINAGKSGKDVPAVVKPLAKFGPAKSTPSKSAAAAAAGGNTQYTQSSQSPNTRAAKQASKPTALHRLAVSARTGGAAQSLASKTAPAKTFTNTTIGKSPAFSRSLPIQAAVISKSRSVTDPENASASRKEQALGPGSDRLKALISKFS